jgi:uncharacterized membrane protein YphA (DoxX/SURF4 family)
MKKYLPTAVRILLGLMFVGSSIAGMMGKAPPPEPEAAQAFMGVLLSSGLLYLVKILELLCGLALISGSLRRSPCWCWRPSSSTLRFFMRRWTRPG